MISPQAASDIIDQAVAPFGVENVPLASAVGRHLAAEVAADTDYPPYDNSAVDGFAVRAADVATASGEAPVRLSVLADVPAGETWNGTLGAGESIRIFTGAPVPAGADAIVPVEATAPVRTPAGESRRDAVEIFEAVGAGSGVRRIGCDMKAGTVVATPGEPLDAGALGVLAALGIASPSVFRRPRVALLLSGDEIIAPSEPLQTGKVRDVNSFTLRPLIQSAGGDLRLIDFVSDTRESVRRAAELALNDCDIIVSVGGVSMGERDLLRPVLREMGMDEVFWKIAQRPGKPMVYGRVGPVHFVGLPGNPISAWTCFHVYVAPMIRKMAGARHYRPTRIRVEAADRFETPAELTYFLRCELRAGNNGRPTAHLTGAQGSHVVSSLRHNDVLMVVPPNVRVIGPGDVMDAIVLNPERCATAWAGVSG